MKFSDWYYQICYRFNEKSCINDRIQPRIWGHSYIVLNFINKNIKAFLKKNTISNASILDVGCGYKPYKKLFHASDLGEYVGIDFFNNNEADIKHDLNKPLVLNKSYDIVLCMDVMEHVKNTENLVITIKNNLKKNGFLIVSIPFAYGIHGSPYDYVRFTRNYFLDFYKNDFELVMLSESNSYFSSMFLHFNNLIFYLPVPYFFKQPFFILNNMFVVIVDKIAEFAVTVIKNKKFYDLCYNAPFEYIGVFKKIS